MVGFEALGVAFFRLQSLVSNLLEASRFDVIKLTEISASFVSLDSRKE